MIFDTFNTSLEVDVYRFRCSLRVTWNVQRLRFADFIGERRLTIYETSRATLSRMPEKRKSVSHQVIHKTPDQLNGIRVPHDQDVAAGQKEQHGSHCLEHNTTLFRIS